MPLDLKPLCLAVVVMAILLFFFTAGGPAPAPLAIPTIPWNPEGAACFHTRDDMKIDGILDERSWDRAGPREKFGHVTGDEREQDVLTSVRLLWSTTHLFIGGEVGDKHVWAKRKQRDTRLHHENEISIYIDPDGDTHEYYRIGINAFGTVSDVFLKAPYRDHPNPEDAGWDIKGLEAATFIDGTENDPSDVDKGWAFEIAIPWSEISPTGEAPKPYEKWRMNFARTHWAAVPSQSGYKKRVVKATGEIAPPTVWTWSPQGVQDLHYPEMWGFVEFSIRLGGHPTLVRRDVADELAHWSLRRIYYQQKNLELAGKPYAKAIEWIDEREAAELRTAGIYWPPRIRLTGDGYVATLEREQRPTLQLTQDGRVKEL